MRALGMTFVLVLGCSGGFDPVRTVGGGNESQGPGFTDPYAELGDNGFETTTFSTLVVLCLEACAHLHAANCDDAPEYMTAQCRFTCEQEVSGFRASCADEAAAVYDCAAEGSVTCSTPAAPAPSVAAGCDEQRAALSKCLDPSTSAPGCTPDPGGDAYCQSLGLSQLFVCPEGITPPPGCVEAVEGALCCP